MRLGAILSLLALGTAEPTPTTLTWEHAPKYEAGNPTIQLSLADRGEAPSFWACVVMLKEIPEHEGALKSLTLNVHFEVATVTQLDEKRRYETRTIRIKNDPLAEYILCTLSEADPDVSLSNPTTIKELLKLSGLKITQQPDPETKTLPAEAPDAGAASTAD